MRIDIEKKAKELELWLPQMPRWDGDALTWLVTEAPLCARAHTKAFGTYTVTIKPNRKAYELRFGNETNERICPTHFTATNRVAWEAEDHFKRLQAIRGTNPTKLKPPSW